MQLNSGDKVALNKSKKASWKNEGIFEYFTEDGKWAIVRTYTSFNPNGGIKYWYPCQCDPKQIKKIDQWNDPDTGFNGDVLWDALSQNGIVDMDQYNQCFYKYATKEQRTLKTICFRSSMKKILQNQ